MNYHKFPSLLLGALLAFAPVALHAHASGLQGSTLNTTGPSGQPTAAATALLFPVISPDCPYDQMTLNQLLAVAQATNIGLFNTARSLLLSRAFTPAAVRNFLVTELCNGHNNGN
jgi:hypothetical protein